MRAIDYSPLLRASVGFDRMMNLLDALPQAEASAPSYPPYNIEKLDEDSYRITMAVAGFGEADLDVTVQDDRLVVSGKQDKKDEASRKFLHRGIATRAFERRFELADHIRVAGARVENGLLHVELVREVPEAMKPRSIKIETVSANKPKVIDQKAA